MFSFDLLLDAVVIGVLLGCFYAAVSLGLSVSFGLLDVPHIAHPAFLVMASYGVFLLNDRYDIDPLLAGLLITPLLFMFGLVAYRLYYETFEKRGSEAGVRGIAFFFGIAFIIEVLLILQFGVDQRSVTASYIGKAWRIGEMRIPFRLVVAFAVAAALTILLTLYLSRTFMGRAIRAVAQDQEALRLMGANPVWIKQWAFGIATAVLGIAGALLIIVAPVDPILDRTYIGRTFCIVVMAGLGSMTGTLRSGACRDGRCGCSWESSARWLRAPPFWHCAGATLRARPPRLWWHHPNFSCSRKGKNMFPTAIAGSLPKPAWLAETQKLWPQWKAQGDELTQAKKDATLLWIKAQEDAGLDIIGDGEQSRQHFVHGFLEQVDGIDFEHKVKMGIRDNRYDAMVPQVVSRAHTQGPGPRHGSAVPARPHEEKNQVHAARPDDDRRYSGRPLLWRPRQDGHGVCRVAEPGKRSLCRPMAWTSSSLTSRLSTSI